MLRYIIKRLGMLVFILFTLSLITFVLSRVVPSEPAKLYAGFRAKPEQVKIVEEKLGLNKPILLQYTYYVRDLLHGDLGISLRTKQPVMQGILTHAPATLELICLAMFFAMIFGVPLGVISAHKENSIIDHSSRLFSVLGVTMPTFWLGLLLQLLFCGVLKIMPLGGRIDTITDLLNPIAHVTGFYTFDALITGNWAALKSALIHLVLPTITLAVYPLGMISRMTRATMLEVLREDYITTARATGFNERKIAFTYALKNAMAPTLTTAGLSIAYMLTSTFYEELIFSWPGLGRYTVYGILNLDYPVIMGVTLLGASFYVIVNLIVDITLVFFDPRIRLE